MDPDTSPGSPGRLLGRTADPSLLAADPALRPAELDAAPAPAPAVDHGRLVGVGVSLTAGSLIGGAALAVGGFVVLIVSSAGLGLGLLVLGIALIATHWGWIHIAQTVADGRDAGAGRDADRARSDWLAGLAPHPRWEVRSDVRDADAAFVLSRIRFDPVPGTATTFGFASTVEHTEVHDAETPAATIAERAEEMRAEAADQTAAARSRFTEAAEHAELARLGAEDDREALAAQTAAARALAEQINAHGRNPPLTD